MMIDVSCPKCKKRFGWSGEAKDRPPCPRCGHQVSMSQIELDAAELKNFRDMLRGQKKNA